MTSLAKSALSYTQFFVGSANRFIFIEHSVRDSRKLLFNGVCVCVCMSLPIKQKWLLLKRQRIHYTRHSFTQLTSI